MVSSDGGIVGSFIFSVFEEWFEGGRFVLIDVVLFGIRWFV